MTPLAIVILNYNGAEHLKTFLPSVIANSGGQKIVVADNCSTDNSVEIMKTKFPDIELILNKENGGFAKGYNEALKQVEAELYLLLNSDVEVGPNWLEPLLDRMKDDTISGCQPKVLAHHNPNSFEHAGASGGFIDKDYFPFCRGRIFDDVEQDQGQYDEAIEVFWATGAAFLIRSKAFWLVDGFDEDFFAHMEEIDLCWRLKKQGHRFMVEPKSTVLHVGGGTLPYSSPFKTYLNFRNSLFMLIKNHEGPLFLKWLRRMTLDGIAGVRFGLRREWAQLNSVWKAHRDMYKSMSKFLKKRKAIKAQSTTFNKKGMYDGSILTEKFLKKNRFFSDLDKQTFN